jgi:AraC-like DNA-binding protein
LLVRYLETLARLAPELEAGARLGAANAAIGLMCAALGASVPSTEHSLRAVLLSEARRYIEEHLGDPGLSPASIAQAHAVSVRTLHAAFESTDESVSALIRRRRLNQCYADLATSSEDQVFTIARRWGFPSAAHFSRAFRRQFGVAPRDIRPPG